MADGQSGQAAPKPVEYDSRGLPVLPQEYVARATKLGLVLTEKPGSVRPCINEDHKPTWELRPMPMGDLHCNTCHPSIATLQAEGYTGKSNLGVPRWSGKNIKREKWETSKSDKNGEVDPATVLWGEEIANNG